MAGNKNSGRLSNAVKHRFEMMLESPGGYKKFSRIMCQLTKEDIYLGYFKEAMDRAHGKAMQSVKPVDDEGNYAPFTIFMPAQISGTEGKAE